MSKTLDIDDNINLWMPTMKKALDGDDLSCPRCGSDNMEVIKESNEKGIGFLLVTCNNCGKSGYSSRVLFKDKHTA